MNQAKNIYRFLALNLALLMLLTSLGFHLDAHFCQGKLKSLSLFGKAKNCYELAGGMTKETCSKHVQDHSEVPGDQVNQKACCTDHSLYVQSQQNPVNVSFDAQTIELTQQFIIAFTLAFFSNEQVENTSPLLAQDKIPRFSKDIYVLNQAFLL